MRTVIIGVGNPLLTDDSVGIGVVRNLREILIGREDVECHELYTGGIRLMESMLGYERAFVVDAMMTGQYAPGTIRVFQPDEGIATCHASSPHDTDIPTSLAIGRELGLPLPREIRIWGIEGEDIATFGEELSPAVAAAVPLTIAQIVNQLSPDSGAAP
jgi:hydrogenase maturation protease